MLFVISCTDHPNSAEKRAANREAHLRYLGSRGGQVLHAGPMLGPDGAPCGSLLVVELADRDAAQAFADADPYAEAGLFAGVAIHGHRLVIRDGKLLA